MLTKQNKQDIYALLCSEFQKKTPIPMKDVQDYLEENGLHFQEFGYKNIQALLRELVEFLDLKESNKQGKKEAVCLLHDYEEAAARLPSATRKKGPSRPAKKAPASQQRKQEEKAKTASGPTPIPHPDRKALEPILLKALLSKKKYQVGKEYPLATLSQGLTSEKVDCHKYGFGKVKNMFLYLPDVFAIRDVSQNGVPQPFVTIKKDYVAETATAPAQKKAEESKAKERKAPAPAPKKGKAKELEDIDFHVPDKLLLSLKETCAIGLEDSSIREALKEDFDKALEKKSFQRRSEGITFPTRFVTKNNESLVAALKKSDGPTDYAYFISYLGPDKDKPKDYLKSMVHFADFDKAIQSLAQLAKKESWCYHNSKDKYIILKIYLQYTFYRLVDQKKIMVDPESGFVSFNTGLATTDYDPIYALLLVNKDKTVQEDYLFQGFTVAGSQGYGKVVVEHFSPLPQKATYVDDFASLILPDNVQIHTDFRHIILDNIDRFPLPFLQNLASPFAEEKKILSQIAKEKNSFKVDRLFGTLEEKIEKNDLFYNLLRTALEMAIAKGLSMIRYDYRFVLPSFFTTRNVLSLMLPLSFGRNNATVDAVLLVEKMPSGNYQGQTILTLKQCYVNSRLILPLDNTYLHPDKIED